MNFRYTAAQSSRITKPSRSKKSSISFFGTSHVKAGAKSLSKKKTKDDTNTREEQLVVLDHNVQMDFQLRDASSIVLAMDQVLKSQWSEMTIYHNRYFSSEAKQNCQESSDLLFSLRGLPMETKADILQYRKMQLPKGGILTINQLYTVFEQRGNTFVDRCLELYTREGQVRKFVISNAQPVISRTGKGGMNSQISYGYEDAEVIVKTDDYLSELSETIASAEVLEAQVLAKFKDFIIKNPSALSVTKLDFSAPELTTLVNTGFLTLTSNHHHEIDVRQYAIAYPRCGTFLKLINVGRSWLVKTLKRTTHKEALEDKLFDKWEGKKMNNFRRPYYGYDLLWILADAKGAGVVEAFETPVGRGWRLTGKL